MMNPHDQNLEPTRPRVEPLENRQMLSASGLDTSFAQNGFLPGYGQVVAIEGNGVIVARHGSTLVGLHPDGSIDKSFNPKTFVAPSSDLIQSDGKRVAVTLTNGQISYISRYFPNGSLDKSFGVNGHVTTFLLHPTRGDGDFSGANPLPGNYTFAPTYLALQGDAIVISGNVGAGFDRGTGIERLTASGKIDHAFGLEAAELIADADAQHATGVFTGKNQRIYVETEEEDGDADIQEFDSQGKLLGDQRIESYGSIQKAIVGRDGTITVLCESQLAENLNGNLHDFALVKWFDADLNLDTTFGAGGEYDILPDVHDENTGGISNYATNLVMSPSGKAVVSIVRDPDSTGPSAASTPYLLQLTAHRVANTADISGFIFNDANSNTKRDAGEAPLRYWPAYVDLNNDGIWNLGEPTAYADYNGYYKITGLAPGHYIVREVRQTGWNRTTPAGPWPAGYYSATLAANHVYSGYDFGNVAIR